MQKRNQACLLYLVVPAETDICNRHPSFAVLCAKPSRPADTQTPSNVPQQSVAPPTPPKSPPTFGEQNTMNKTSYCRSYNAHFVYFCSDSSSISKNVLVLIATVNLRESCGGVRSLIIWMSVSFLTEAHLEKKCSVRVISNSLVYYPFNPQGVVAGGQKVDVGFGDWGADVADRRGVLDFWEQADQVDANWQRGTFGGGKSWNVPVVGIGGFNRAGVSLGNVLCYIQCPEETLIVALIDSYRNCVLSYGTTIYVIPVAVKRPLICSSNPVRKTYNKRGIANPSDIPGVLSGGIQPGPPLSGLGQIPLSQNQPVGLSASPAAQLASGLQSPVGTGNLGLLGSVLRQEPIQAGPGMLNNFGSLGGLGGLTGRRKRRSILPTNRLLHWNCAH
uniref:Uncharacterized protein n=1 Tax=Romanomermis culicivorax TaxID=13658 RepID=A0A915HEU3_ROMCU